MKSAYTLLLALTLTVLCPCLTQAQTVVLTEDFSGDANIFGIDEAGLTAGKAVVFASGMADFGNVLAVSNATADGTISANSAPVATGTNGTVTTEWDAFHGYYNYDCKTTVSLLNSDDAVIASYTYNANGCKIISAAIGGADVTFDAFSFQSKTNATQGANGWANGKPFASTAGCNPHIAVTLESSGKVSMAFTLNGATAATLLGNVGTLKKDIAKMRVTNTFSRSENTDRCYGLDNIKVTTDVQEEQDPNYIEAISSVTLSSPQSMTFGPDPDTAYKNDISLIITGVDGTNINETTIDEKVTDFNVTWDIEGFKTANDTEGQYCDSYGTFSVNNQGAVATSFDLRNVPMNFFGLLKATVTYNGTTTTVSKYVVALGDKSTAAGQVLPEPGYPKTFSAYPDALKDYVCVRETYGASSDLILGGWCVAGSDVHTATLQADADGTKFVRVTGNTVKKSHVLTKKITAPKGQLIFSTRLRFNAAGAVVTLTGGYPFWSSKNYTCPVSLSFDGTGLTLNGTKLKQGDADAVVSKDTWYDVVLSADKTTESCYAMVFTPDGTQVAQSAVQPWAETSSPTFFSIGMGNSNTGSVDMAACEAFVPTVDAAASTLTADKTTLSIPNGDTATLTAHFVNADGYAITQQAQWSVVEEDMQQSVVISPSADDSHVATLSLTPTAEAGTATVQVNIGGATKTVALTLTSSAEMVKFTKSTTSITIPLDASETVTTDFAAIVVDGKGADMGRNVTLAAYEKDGTTAFNDNEAIGFDAATGILSVTAAAQPTTLVIRATGQNSANEPLTKSVTVNIHGMKFDFGYTDEASVAEGFTAVGTTTSYNDVAGYGLAGGQPAAGGSEGAAAATDDYLQGALEFSFKVQRGVYYTVTVTYQGELTTGYVNSDLAGYTLGTQTTLTTEEFTIPATTDVIDLHLAASGNAEARIASVTVTKQPARQKRAKRVVHHIGDSTSANNGSWAYTLSKSSDTYPELFDLCTFANNGAGGRNLSTYYTQGKLYSVLKDIYPGDIVMFGNNGTNGMGSSFEADMNYYLDAAETLGAQIIINSYTPHGAVSNYASGYKQATHTFDSYRRDAYETIVRKVAEEREAADDNYLGFVEIGKNADAIFNAYVADYAANGYDSADAAAQAIITCFGDHNHYSNGRLACDLMLKGYGTEKGIVAQLVDILRAADSTVTAIRTVNSQDTPASRIYTLNGVCLNRLPAKGLYIVGGRKMMVK